MAQDTLTSILPITFRGKLMLESELKKLIHEERPQIIKAIEEARAHGDISENAEYDAAKERQGMIEGRIGEIQGKLAGVEAVDPATIKADKIVFGASVEIQDTETDEKSNYQIVGVDEADVKKGMISIISPLSRAMIGKKVADLVTVQSPKGDKEYEILAFKYV
ncbi:MAG: transcription elongation factor GreA [Bdellovibrionaceae bacterium]|nr:transcription elongation factor GreA [Bdellovibrio sp.]